MPKGQCLRQEILECSLENFRKSQPNDYDKVVVGAAIFESSSDSNLLPTPRLLLLKRAAHEKQFPNVFELPGGHVEPQDSSIQHAIVREVQEETGLDVTDIITELEPMLYTTEEKSFSDISREAPISKSTIQLNYIVSVSGYDVKLNPDEHSDHSWTTEQNVAELPMSSKMRIVVHEAFRWAVEYTQPGLNESEKGP
ncbi:MAG: hypothetical protein Q9157_004576 [Trypethelium eluteriae]